MNETITKELPNPLTTLEEGSRTDISWITTEKVDRVGDVVIAQGLNATEFGKNPVVLLNHDMSQGIGRNLWLRTIPGEGVIAKTHYPPRPDTHKGDWPADVGWDLVRSKMLSGKSIRFRAIDAGPPTAAEAKAHPGAKRIIRTWTLIEYSGVYVPANPDTVVIDTSKALDQVPVIVSFITLTEATAAIQKTLAAIDPKVIVQTVVGARSER